MLMACSSPLTPVANGMSESDAAATDGGAVLQLCFLGSRSTNKKQLFTSSYIPTLRKQKKKKKKKKKKKTCRI